MRPRDRRPLSQRLGSPSSPDFRNRPAGAVIGVVTNNTDPLGQGRIKVRFPWLHDAEESHWARIAQVYAGPGRGSFWIPEVGDEAVVVFERGDPNHPYIIGSVWNGEDVEPPPGNSGGANDFKIFRTRAGHQLKLEDTDGAERITLTDGPNQRHLVIDVAEDTITVTADPGDITFEAPADTLTVDCKDLEIEASNSSTWDVGAQFADLSDTRTETISGADTLSVKKTWTIGAPSTTANAQVASMSAQTTGVSVSGSLTMQNAEGRQIETQEVRRTTLAPETITAGQMEVKADQAVAYVSNGPISLTAGAQLSLKAMDATVSTSAVITLQGANTELKGTAALSLSAQLIKLC